MQGHEGSADLLNRVVSALTLRELDILMRRSSVLAEYAGMPVLEFVSLLIGDAGAAGPANAQPVAEPSPDLIRALAKRMRRARLLRGISARRLAVLAGVSQTHVAYLELLARDRSRAMAAQNIGLVTAARLAAALGISAQFLCFGSGSDDPGAQAPGAREGSGRARTRGRP